MSHRRQIGRPLFIRNNGAGSEATPALPLPLTGSNTGYNEAWLQGLIDQHPTILPLSEFEPAFESPTSICREFPVGTGYIDNLLLTPSGGIALVECKLWRNPEARRKVLAQVLDYAHAVSRMSVEEFSSAALKARKGQARSLYEIACRDGDPELSEAGFNDALARNLKNGRLLLVVVGDGIREDLEAISRYLQISPALHFVLALVEMSIFEVPKVGMIVQPRTLAQTVLLERGIVRVEGARVTLETLKPGVPEAAAKRSQTLSEEEYFAFLGKSLPTLPSRLRTFFDRLSELGVEPRFKTKSVVLRWYGPDGKGYNLGSINIDGTVGTDHATLQAAEIGRLDIGHSYLKDIAGFLPDSDIRGPADQPQSRFVRTKGRRPSILEMLDHEADWIEAIRKTLSAIQEHHARTE